MPARGESEWVFIIFIILAAVKKRILLSHVYTQVFLAIFLGVSKQRGLYTQVLLTRKLDNNLSRLHTQ
jgi:hypothetical protein